MKTDACVIHAPLWEGALVDATGVFVKRYLFLLTIGLCVTAWAILGLHLVSVADGNDPLTEAETALFARDYASEPMEDRLSRLESVVYGQAQQGDPAARQAKLDAVLSQNVMRPKTASPAAPGDNPSARQAAAEPAAPDATNYPAVTQLEERLFGQNFAKEPVAGRLERLEQRVFQQTYGELPMVDRVDQLTLKVMPDSPLGMEERNSGGGGLPASGKDFAPSNLAVYSKLTALEEQVFGKSFGGELIAARMNRLESRVFGTPQKGSIDSRMDRLLANYGRAVPQQSYAGSPQAYDPRSGSSFQRPPASAPPQQIIVGAGMGGYSQEFMNMLPGNLRQQVESRGTGTVVGTPNPTMPQQPEVYSGPGTWSHQTQAMTPYAPNSLYAHPGQIYRGQANAYTNITPYVPQQPMPQYNAPQGFSGNGIAPLYQPPGVQPNTMGGIQQAMPYPNTASGAMNLKQSLMILEHQIFGRAYPGSNVGLRLNNLEQQIFGQTYPNLSYQQRVNRLMRQIPNSQSALPYRNPIASSGNPQGGMKGVLGQALGMMMYNQMNRSNYGYDPYGTGFGQQSLPRGW